MNYILMYEIIFNLVVMVYLYIFENLVLVGSLVERDTMKTDPELFGYEVT